MMCYSLRPKLTTLPRLHPLDMPVTPFSFSLMLVLDVDAFRFIFIFVLLLSCYGQFSVSVQLV